MHQRKQKPNQLKLHSIPISKFICMLHGFSYSIPLLSATALLWLGLVAVNPTLLSDAVFAETTKDVTTTPNGSASVNLTVTRPQLTKESTTNAINYISTGVTVQTSNIENYAIFLQAADGFTGNLVGVQKGVEIAGVGDNVSTSAFPENRWGYGFAPDTIPDENLNTLTYSTVPESDAAPLTALYRQQTANEADSGKSFTLAFAANFGSLTVPDHYKTSVLLSIAASPVEVTTLSKINQMQELTPEICRQSAEHETKRLEDTRDNKTYWVTKLKDGNCWMTQNLDYNDPNSTKVSTPSSWTSTDKTYRAYYDPGNYYFTNPSSWTGCSNNGTGLSVCTSSGWSTSGDSHYHAGNYYSWAAATNNTSNSISSGNATDSICPAGWQLPTSDSMVNNGSFGNLTTAYNVTGSNVSVLFNNPIYFMPSGRIDSGLLQLAGYQGWYWSSTVNVSTSAYILYFNPNSVVPSYNYNGRYYGFSVRCLVQSFPPAQNLETATYMQEVTKKTCGNSITEKQKQLIDYRDGKTYWVAKLKDGNCWMTQNLDYDDPEGTKVTDTAGSNGGPSSGTWINKQTERQYWDPGQKVVSGNTLMNATDSTDAHLLVGNYYSWESATAGAGKSTNDGSSAVSSICPAGWQLPTSKNSNNGAFERLQSAGSIGNTGSKLNEKPYYFQYGGYAGSGNLYSAGSSGYYWSSTANNSDNSYKLYFNASEVYPAYNANRFDGVPIRCLALGS